MKDQYITIASYDSTAKADFFKEQLKKYGIDAFVSQAHALLEPLQENHNENVRLNIAAKDREEALKILKNTSVG